MLDLTAEIRSDLVTIDHSFYDPEFPLPVADLERIAAEMPTAREIQEDWGRYAMNFPMPERNTIVAFKLEVLEGLVADPEAWVTEALEQGGLHG